MERPYVVCHMLASLDGKIDGDFMTVPESAPVLQEFSKLRDFYACPATLYGTVTMQSGYSDGLVGTLLHRGTVYPKEDFVAVPDASNYVVSVDPQGILGWKSNWIEKKNRPKAHVIEALTGQVSDDYVAYLRERNISYLFAGEEPLDCTLLLNKLKKLFGIDRLMVSGGGRMNWSLLQEGLMDELSLLIAPVADGSRTSVSIFEKEDFLPPKSPVSFRIKSVEQIENSDGLWLRYEVKR